MARLFRKLSHFTKREIDWAFDNAKRVLWHKAFTILAAPAQREFGGILPVISRKVGNAPTRNKIRRRLKSIFYESKLHEKKWDLVVICRKEAAELSFEEMQELLLKAHTTAQMGGGKKRTKHKKVDP